MLSIGGFSKLSLVTTNALRYYDEIGLLKPIHVNSENGYRYYDTKQLYDILFINKLKLYSFSLDEIAEVMQDKKNIETLLVMMKKKQNAAAEKLKQLQQVAAQMQKDIQALERGNHIMSYLDKIDVNLVDTQTKNLLFVREKMNVKDYATYLGGLYDTIVQEKYTVVGAPISIFHDEEFNPESYDMEIAIPVLETSEATRMLPPYQCAMAVLKGPYSELTSVYARLKEWIEENGYSVIAPTFEIYISDPFKTEPENILTEVYIPVKNI